MSLLTYEKYKNRIIVRGDRQKYSSVMKSLGGRWYTNLKGGAGWSLPDYKEKDVITLVEASNSENSLLNS